LPEVSGGHALHIDIADVDGWAKAMRMLRDGGADPAGVTAGKQFVARFNRTASVDAAIASLEAACATSHTA
jgi:hypothetical protein